MTLNINRVFPRNWYAVSYSKDIKKIPVKKELLAKILYYIGMKKEKFRRYHLTVPIVALTYHWDR
ncbi:vanillate O-demethylase oxygenase [Bacillus cereus]|uniref:vanillate O-demethylase oxygenase n=1 Tax=Bacillus cereus TaxID=1396 RepID=UPI0020D27572|nr:vanillate O-demethylase oxygenase [Bacillus cereus]